MNFRSVLILTITAPLASIALAQMYPAPQPKANPSLTPPPTSTTAPAPAATAPATAAPAVQSAAAPDMPTIPSHNCVAPQYPGKNAPNEKIKNFNAGYKDYSDCISKYVASVRGVRDAAMAKGNGAVEEYNKYTEEIKKQLDADK